MSVTKYVAAAFRLKLTGRAFRSGGQPQGNPIRHDQCPADFVGADTRRKRDGLLLVG